MSWTLSAVFLSHNSRVESLHSLTIDPTSPVYKLNAPYQEETEEVLLFGFCEPSLDFGKSVWNSVSTVAEFSLYSSSVLNCSCL